MGLYEKVLGNSFELQENIGCCIDLILWPANSHIPNSDRKKSDPDFDHASVSVDLTFEYVPITIWL